MEKARAPVAPFDCASRAAWLIAATTTPLADRPPRPPCSRRTALAAGREVRPGCLPGARRNIVVLGDEVDAAPGVGAAELHVSAGSVANVDGDAGVGSVMGGAWNAGPEDGTGGGDGDDVAPPGSVGDDEPGVRAEAAVAAAYVPAQRARSPLASWLKRLCSSEERWSVGDGGGDARST